MAVRTDEEAVREVIKTSLTGTQVAAFIEDASLWVTEELGALTPPLSDARLEIIERYLACALIRIRDVGLKSVTIEDVSENYQVDAAVSDYLLRAASFDPTGKIRMHFLNDTTGAAAGKGVMAFGVGSGFRCQAPRRSCS